MTLRRAETSLAYATIAALLIYAPIETVYSWPALASPYYVIDVIGMLLMLAGVVRSLRARPGTAPDVLAVGWAWSSANFWRAAFDRVSTLDRGGALRVGAAELRFVIGELLVSLLCLTIGLTLVYRTRLSNEEL